MPQQPDSSLNLESPDLKTIVAQATQLSRAERLELITILQAFNQAETDFNRRANQKEIALNRRGIRGGRGSFEDKYINGYGPYRYLRYWYGKTHKSVYLGKVNKFRTLGETE
ncbi:MAG: hypothetical protein HC827_02870 [Cyanobacteria bacterium RM1_2_2]|nr:hypothetical protein [Cyanobacteria bacterium RM1_2_2]